jgi:dGTP triphosphohydrolase
LPMGDSGLAWCRHPLAFLTEAADDICYRIADLEDGCEVGRITVQELSGFCNRLPKPHEKTSDH